MKRRVKFLLEQLQERNTPSGVSAAGAVLSSQTERPIGGISLPPSALVNRNAHVAFAPMGTTRFIAESNEAPPPVRVTRDSSIAFVRPGATRFLGESND
jgi:hypothetical protein